MALSLTPAIAALPEGLRDYGVRSTGEEFTLQVFRLHVDGTQHAASTGELL